VASEHLDGNQYQFITIAGDGQICIWDTRYEAISNDELRHVARPKHVPLEKVSNKDGGLKPQWAPIYKAHLKRTEGVGELSLCRMCGISTISHPLSSANNQKQSTISSGTDYRSHVVLSTEEGDIFSVDLTGTKVEAAPNKDEEDYEPQEQSKEFIKWIADDHVRPCVGLQQSPFFPNIFLSVSERDFNIWKMGQEKPLFRSPHSNSSFTAGAWSPTRPAVLIISCADGSLLVWDFTDSSYRPSIELKATHTRITSIEFLSSSMSIRQQLLAVGDESGTLHIVEIPRNIIKPIPREEILMTNFIDRELKRSIFLKENLSADENGLRPAAVTDSLFKPKTDGDAASEDGKKESKEEEDSRKAKEEDDFYKLEAMFITELSLTSAELPEFAKKIVPSSPDKNKKGGF